MTKFLLFSSYSYMYLIFMEDIKTIALKKKYQNKDNLNLIKIVSSSISQKHSFMNANIIKNVELKYILMLWRSFVIFVL